MANIKFPKRFEEKLSHDSDLQGIVKTVSSKYGEIIGHNQLYFFEDYTDHGIKHIEGVLRVSDSLITERTINEILQPRDIGFYILSVLLHDIGMHIHWKGFTSIVNDFYDHHVRVKEFDDISWSKLWKDYLDESHKFSSKQMLSIFGKRQILIKEPNLTDSGDLSNDQRKLIGEFIRRHHSRLSHEIALKDFPGFDNNEGFAADLETSERNLVGLIARSHGIELRKAINYLDEHYKETIRNPLGCHVVFLMVLLRLADYFQIDKSRTSKMVLRARNLASPKSSMEHNAHYAIKSIDYKFQNDPERIFVQAEPEDSAMYLKLTALIKDIQRELDVSWAVIGEVYGGLSDANKPTIKYRRIKSNLENDVFKSKLPFVPEQFYFRANEDIVKLLIAPLYGNDPTYGIRELVQNSVDACRELGAINNDSKHTYKPHVNIEFIDSDNGAVFIISDNGRGMDDFELRNYFLCAGASFRTSYKWTKQYLDDSNRSIVQRSGRFGIGVLAAFLLGTELDVETKKVGTQYGYKFKASLYDEQINVMRSKDIKKGTRIKINLSNQAKLLLNSELDKFKNHQIRGQNPLWWQWYCLNDIQVKYMVYNSQTIMPANQSLKFEPLRPDLNWREIDAEGYNKVLWTYNRTDVNWHLICNGIFIPISNSELRRNLKENFFENAPLIQVVDNDATLPLTLDRNGLAEPLSFAPDISKDMCKDFIAYLLITTDTGIVRNNLIVTGHPRLNYPGMSKYDYPFAGYSYGPNIYDPSKIDYYYTTKSMGDYLLISEKGFIINYNYFLAKLGQINAIYVNFKNRKNIRKLSLDLGEYFMVYSHPTINTISEFETAILPFESKYGSEINARFIMTTDKYEFLFKKTTKGNKKRLNNWVIDKHTVDFQQLGLTGFHFGNINNQSIVTKEFIEAYRNDINLIREYQIKCEHLGHTVLDDLLERYFGDDVIIPFKLEERKRKFPLAFEELKKYMEFHKKETTKKTLG